MKTKNIATIFAIAAAALYAINVPLSKILLEHISPTMLAAFLYIGAGFGMLIYSGISKSIGKTPKAAPLTKKELPYTIAMIILDIIAPILLMFGIKFSTAANVSLINNFEIVVTSIIALVVFKEVISKKLWIAITLVTIASAILTLECTGMFEFNIGSLFVLGATLCWGFENNCTKMMSSKSSTEIVIIKGIFSGLGSLIVAFIIGESIPAFIYVIFALLLGFVAYGLSIKLYILAQRDLGAAKTSAYYSIAPFLGVTFSMLLLQEKPNIQFHVALAIMLISTYFMIKDSIQLQHTHEHSHGNIIHTHTHVHTNCDDIEQHNHEHKNANNPS